MNNRRCAAAASILVAVLLAPTTNLAARPADIDSDIDGDGYGDLLVGVPLEDIGRHTDSGVVHPLFGARSRRGADLRGLLRQGAEIGERPERDDGFGGSVELADVNGDGYDDAIIGSPGERINGMRRAGLVHVIPGSSSGLRTADAVVLTEGNGVGTAPGVDNAFGWDVKGGDFDGDGYDDIAISSVGHKAGNDDGAGAVIVISGSVDGLDPTTAETFSQAGPIAGRPDPGDSFGRALTVGNFDGDGYDDLVIGAPGEWVRGHNEAGAVSVIYGSSAGLSADRDDRFTQIETLDRPEAGDLFGFSVAATDLNCDGLDDLVVGAPNEDLRGSPNAGSVHVLVGTPAGLVAQGNQKYSSGRAGVPGQSGNNGFGTAVAGGDFDGNGCGDLAVGAPFATINGASAAGNVTVIMGHRAWRRVTLAEVFDQQGSLIGEAVPGDFFGNTLAVTDWNGDGRDDLAVGVPNDDVRGRQDAGSLVLMFGSRSGLSANGAWELSQRSPLRNAPEAGDRFASSLADGLG